MTHADFVQGFRQGRLGVRINKTFALSSLGDSRPARRFQWLNMAWTTAWVLTLPAAGACWVWVGGWLGASVLLLGVVFPVRFRKSASRYLLEQAMEDSRFFDEVQNAYVLSVTYR
jgi:hypothetical protein